MHEGRTVLWGSLNGECQLTLAEPVTGMREQRLELWIRGHGKLLDVKDAEGLREAITTGIMDTGGKLSPQPNLVIPGSWTPEPSVSPGGVILNNVLDWVRQHRASIPAQAVVALYDVLDLPPTQEEIETVWRDTGHNETLMAEEIVRLRRQARRASAAQAPF